jgi:diguanylate cyclase (GGDEF)-like protein
MSIGQHGPMSTGRPRQAPRLVHPRAWSLWATPRPFLAYVLIVDAAAVTVIALTATLIPPTTRHLAWLGTLVIASILHLELTLGIERLRELHPEGRAYTSLKSIWIFAALLVLPLPLVAAMVALTYTHIWLRVSRRVVPHRWLFSASSLVLASAAGAAVLQAFYPATYPSLPSGWIGFGVIAITAIVGWAVNRVFTSVGRLLSYSGSTTLRAVLGPAADNLMEFCSLALGVLVATVLDDPAFLLALAIPIVVIHRSLLLPQFGQSAHRDRITGLHNAGFWYEMATKALERSTRERAKASLLMIHVDDYRAINDRHGLDAGNRVLRRVADTLKAELGHDDVAGRLADEDFVLLLSTPEQSQAAAVAERIRQAVRQLEIELDQATEPTTINNLTVSIGGAIFPDNATTLDALMLTADNAEIAAENRMGDQVIFVRPRVQPAADQPNRASVTGSAAAGH